MIDLTPEAQLRLDAYLAGVRGNARGTAVSAAEIEQDVREHVAAALAGTAAPVDLEQLDRVLTRLGSPSQWFPDEELTPWQRLVRRLAAGPEDWRLAYATFALTVLGLIVFPFGGFVLVFAAFFLGRAFVDLVGQPAISRDARRWLVYPSFLIMLFFAMAIVLITPIAPFGIWFLEEGGFQRIFGIRPQDQPVSEVLRLSFGAFAIAIGAWWLVVGAILAVMARQIAWLFSPITASFRRRHGLVLCALATTLIAAGMISLLLL